MGNTVFSKLMIIFIPVILLGTAGSAVLVSFAMQQEYTQRVETEMLETAQVICNLAAMNYGGRMTVNDVLTHMSVEAQVNGDVIWLVDDANRIWLASGPRGTTPDVTEEQVLQYYGDMLGDLNQGKTVKTVSENANTALGIPVMTVAMPIIDVGGAVRGSVFVHKELSVINRAMVTIYRQILLSGLLACIVALVLCYFLTRKMLQPLKYVNRASKELAKGNFDVRIQTDSRDEIGQLAGTFNALAEDLGKYENIRRSFVANVSHELRSPLTSMRGLVQGTLDGTIPQDERDYYLDVVLSEIKRMDVLVNDLLDLARIESGRIRMQMCDVEITELVRRAIITFEGRITQGSINLEAEIPAEKIFVLADAARITQVVTNLMDNAIKFTPAGHLITVRVEPQDGTVLVSVSNTGSTIAEEDLPFVFERFYKADKSRNREQAGTGLGLSIAKRLLDAHGQKIWAESSGSVTTFFFTLKRR